MVTTSIINPHIFRLSISIKISRYSTEITLTVTKICITLISFLAVIIRQHANTILLFFAFSDFAHQMHV
jgi:hypothetical protein